MRLHSEICCHCLSTKGVIPCPEFPGVSSSDGTGTLQIRKAVTDEHISRKASEIWGTGSIIRREVGGAKAVIAGIAAAYRGKALKKDRFRPMYALANMGHPSRTFDLGCEGKSAGFPYSKACTAPWPSS